MKRTICIALLILTGCASSRKTVTQVQISAEQQRIDFYYDNRPSLNFRPSFYDVSDSVFASLKGDDTAIFTGLYGVIRAERFGDSTNQHAKSPNYYPHLRNQLDIIISAGRAGY